VIRYTESIGKYYSVARTVKKSMRLTSMDALSILIFASRGIHAFPFIACLWFIPCTYNSEAKEATDDSFEDNTAYFNTNGNSFNNIAFWCFVLCLLLIISGIETNPGPSTNDSFSSTNSSYGDNEFFKQSISFVHLNVQSIVPKLDLVLTEFSCHDILSFSESWLSPHVGDGSVRLPEYKFPPFRRDRPDRQGGGVIVYMKDNINCKLRADLQVGDIECIWIELVFKNKKNTYMVLFIYLPIVLLRHGKTLTSLLTLPSLLILTLF